MRITSCLLLCVLALTGCGTFTDSIARRASEMAAESAFRAAKEVELNRRLHLTLVGGPHLNQGKSALPKPVMACVYVVLSPDWRPPLQSNVGECGSKEKDAGLVASSKQLVAPNQIVQLEILLAATRDAWVVIDADFAQRPSNYLPLRLPVEGRGWVHLSAWLEGASLYDGKQPLPAPPIVKEPVSIATATEPSAAPEEPLAAKRDRSPVKKSRRVSTPLSVSQP